MIKLLETSDLALLQFEALVAFPTSVMRLSNAGYISTLRNSLRSRAWGSANMCSYSVEKCRIVKVRLQLHFMFLLVEKYANTSCECFACFLRYEALL